MAVPAEREKPSSLQDSSSGESGHGTVDVRALMAAIRERVKADLQSNPTPLPSFKSYAADGDSKASRKAGELLHSEELRYLNSNYSFSSQIRADQIQSHRGGFIGKLIVKIKRKLMRMIWDGMLRDYLQAERDFNANIVRFMNDVSKYVDARDASNFWELIRKVDVDVTKALERIERIGDEANASLRSSERRMVEDLNRSLKEMTRYITELQGTSAQHVHQLQQLDSVARGLEGAVARLGRQGSSTDQAVTHSADTSWSNRTASTSPIDLSYVLLENRFRGSEAEISRRLGIYPAYFAGAQKPVVEIGAGRGELQLLFAQAAVPSYGIDTDAGMVQVAKEKHAKVELGDGLAHLRNLPDRSVGGIIAIQVVEHLTQAQLSDLFQLATKKVVSGGKVIFETINPQSVTALSSNYFRDPTHVWPLHPDTMSFAMTLAGLDVQEVRKLSPVPTDAQLREVPVQEYMTPRWAETIELLNHNVRQLNQLLYGFQDYCIVAQVR